MSGTEIAHRVRHQFANWVDRVVSEPTAKVPRQVLERHAPRLANPSSLLPTIRDEMPARFFSGVHASTTAEDVKNHLPNSCRRVLVTADELLEGRFNLLSYRGLSFGSPIDWQLDPVSGRRARLAHWTRLDPLDAAEVGDTKVVWELNRLQWVAQLAHAHVLTGDARYAAEAMRTVSTWIDANPPGFGINWTSSLEVAYRLMSWSWTLMLLRQSPLLSVEWAAQLLAAIWQHATYVRAHLSYYFSPNTHLTGEALGLFYAGTLFTEFDDAKDWRETGLNVLVAQLQRQTSTDGVYFEHSTCYQRYTVDTYLHLLLLAGRNGIEVPPFVRKRVAQMAEFLMGIQRPDGGLPSIGDDDGGALLALTPLRAGDASATFDVAAFVTERADFAHAAGGPTVEGLWLTDRQALAMHACAKPAIPAASRVFLPGGYAVMRSGRAREAHYLMTDVGPLGCPVTGGHGHADLLSIQCSIFGDPCLIDAGTYCYTAEPVWRDFFRSTAAHSTVRCDQREQAEPAATFGWRQHRPRAWLRAWQSNDVIDYLDADHDGYQRLPNPVTHRRRVLFVKPHYWLVIDDLDGAGEHHIEVAFQFAPLTVNPGGSWVCAETENGHALWVTASATTTLDARLVCGSENPISGWISRGYGQRLPAPRLTYSGRAVLPCRALTLLVPGVPGPSPQATFTCDDAGTPIGVAFNDVLPEVTVSESTLTVGGVQLTIPRR